MIKRVKTHTHTHTHAHKNTHTHTVNKIQKINSVSPLLAVHGWYSITLKLLSSYLSSIEIHTHVQLRPAPLSLKGQSLIRLL